MAGISREHTMQALYNTFTQARAIDPDTRLIQCQRCAHIISPKPAQTGEKRIREHPRTRFMVRPDFPEGGRIVANIVVLCGVCAKSHSHYGPFALKEQYAQWLGAWEADIQRHENEILAEAEVERLLTEDAMSAGEIQSEGLQRITSMDLSIPPEAMEDYEQDDGMEDVLEELSPPPKEKKSNPIDEY